MANEINSYDISGLPPTMQAIAEGGIDNLNPSVNTTNGAFGDPIVESIPKHIKAQNEKEMSQGNSHIVLGRDRPASRASGYGGQGHTGASSIDLVVGRGGPSPDATTNVDPNFRSDSARIYISQKTDIDTNFNLADGAQGNMTARSGIGIKADTVRVVGTDGIKLVTRSEPKNSKDGTASHNGIELIACNDETDIQSIVKGENLVEALQEFEKRFNELSSIVLSFLKLQAQFNTNIASHTHLGTSPVGAISTVPSVSLVASGLQASMEGASGMIDNYKNRINTNILWNTKYLTAGSSKYICSKYNKVN